MFLFFNLVINKDDSILLSQLHPDDMKRGEGVISGRFYPEQRGSIRFVERGEGLCPVSFVC